jgi:hypothetical protein
MPREKRNVPRVVSRKNVVHLQNECVFGELVRGRFYRQSPCESVLRLTLRGFPTRQSFPANVRAWINVKIVVVVRRFLFRTLTCQACSAAPKRTTCKVATADLWLAAFDRRDRLRLTRLHRTFPWWASHRALAHTREDRSGSTPSRLLARSWKSPRVAGSSPRTQPAHSPPG